MDRQQSLFDQPPKEPRPPHSGGPTSQAAAEAILPNAATLRHRVLCYIAEQGGKGATDAEIQAALSMAGNTERPRRQELEKVKLIRDSGKTRPTPSGRQAVVWVADMKALSGR
jgi:hypothetical protein